MLSKRELESRFEVWTEQYVTRANIEAETTESIARTLILPAALRHLALIGESGVDTLGRRRTGAGRRPRRGDRRAAHGEPLPRRRRGHSTSPIYARDNQLTAMAKVREAADKLERVVADDLWPLPKYAEMLFIK